MKYAEKINIRKGKEEDNESAIGFYEKIAADLDPEWINCELSHTQLEAMRTAEKQEKALVPAWAK